MNLITEILIEVGNVAWTNRVRLSHSLAKARP
jgi:hypothetical protein